MSDMLGVALHEARGPLTTLIERMSGQDGAIWLRRLNKFNRGENPFALEYNEHGHIVLTFTGLDITGAAEVQRLEAEGNRVSSYAKSCLLSTREDSYDKHHRLMPGCIYKIALMPGREIERDSDRTTANLRSRGMDHYGYGKPVAGLIPRVRENLLDKQMEELGIWYATALHEPITASDGNSRVLSAIRYDDGRRVFAYWGRLDDQWVGDGVFVFPVSTSGSRD